MRFALLILAAVLMSLGASWLIWRDRLTPTTLTKHASPAPAALQRQYGSRISPDLATALERKLPPTFDTSGGFDTVTKRLRDATGVRIFVNWRSLERYGRVNERTPINIAVGGMTLQQALTRILASVQSTEPLAALANDDALFIDAAPELEWTTMTRVYDVRDLLPPRSTSSPAANTAAANTAAAAAIIAGIEKNIAPGTWRPQNTRNGPRRPGAIQHLAGQLIVTHTAE